MRPAIESALAAFGEAIDQQDADAAIDAAVDLARHVREYLKLCDWQRVKGEPTAEWAVRRLLHEGYGGGPAYVTPQERDDPDGEAVVYDPLRGILVLESQAHLLDDDEE